MWDNNSGQQIECAVDVERIDSAEKCLNRNSEINIQNEAESAPYIVTSRLVVMSATL